jgi:hypothetical protein
LRFSQTIPIVIVGTHKDKLDAETWLSVQNFSPQKATSGNLIRKKQANALVDKVAAYAYVQVSSLTGDGVMKAFKTAIRAALESKSTQQPPTTATPSPPGTWKLEALLRQPVSV